MSMRHGTSAADLEPYALAQKLRRTIEGEVRFDAGSRALYATDSSNYRQVPIGIVIPRRVEDVFETLELCREAGAPVLSRGAGTSLAGQCCNTAVILDFSKYLNRIIGIDSQRKQARVQPGVIADHLNYALEKHRLLWGPAPATHQWCTFGGMIGNNSCGVHSQLAGRTSDNVEGLEIVTYRGLRMRVTRTAEEQFREIIGRGGPGAEIYSGLRALGERNAHLIRKRFPKIPRRVSGYGLNELLPENGFHVARALVGSEATCVTVLEATVNLVYSPPFRSLLVIGFGDVYHAGDYVPEVDAHGPIGLEGLDGVFFDGLRKKELHTDLLHVLPPARAYLFAEFGGETQRESDAAAEKLARKLSGHREIVTRMLTKPEEQKALWRIRDSGLGATAHIPGDKENHEGWEDSAVPPAKLGPYLRELRKLFNKYDYHGSLYGHFGQGCVHTRIDFDLKTPSGIARFRSFIEEASDLVVEFGGSFSGEHGDGQSRAELLPKLYGAELVKAFEEFKSIWDPDWKMNPGKIVRPYKITENLRFGTHYRPPRVRTHFKFPEDHGSFAGATERCVGVGECRRHEHGTMCPSFMVTHEEMHTTRGRARLLFEMLQGNPMRNGWRNETVKEALDLCLACKGCKGDCPVKVDMATYKAEFLSHYYQRRLRPVHAYVFGLIHRWARMARIAPRFFNYFSQHGLFSSVLKRLAGVAPERSLPPFAIESFKHWYRKHRSGETPSSRPRVILWPDTFNNYFHPHIARAALEVLEDAGFSVHVPQHDFCCGRPLYDYGMLDTAERWLKRILDRLDREIQAGTPFIVLEPSCAAVFRDELTNLFPGDLNAQRLRSQTFLLSEFLVQRAPDYPRRALPRTALVHLHCHHRAVMGPHAEQQLLERLGLHFEILDSGCCGMAGAFGFERGDHYAVSVKCGERVLLPRVREVGNNTLIITNGFSCHEQIQQLTPKKPMHIAEVLQMAIHEGQEKDLERAEVHAQPHVDGRRDRWIGAGIAALATAGPLFWKHRHARRKHKRFIHEEPSHK